MRPAGQGPRGGPADADEPGAARGNRRGEAGRTAAASRRRSHPKARKGRKASAETRAKMSRGARRGIPRRRLDGGRGRTGQDAEAEGCGGTGGARLQAVYSSAGMKLSDGRAGREGAAEAGGVSRGRRRLARAKTRPGAVPARCAAGRSSARPPIVRTTRGGPGGAGPGHAAARLTRSPRRTPRPCAAARPRPAGRAGAPGRRA